MVATGRGVLQRILVPEGETAAVNELLALIVPAGPDAAEDQRDATEKEPRAVAAADPLPDRPAPAPAPAGPRQQVTPRARRLATDLGVDLDSVVGTGPGGRVTEDDVTAAATSGA